MDLYIKSGEHRGSRQYAYRASLDSRRIPNLVKADCHSLPFKDGCFRVVHCFEVMEHKGVKPLRLVKELLRVAKLNVVLSVPSIWSWQQYPQRNKAHARVYRSRDLSSMFKNYPFQIEVLKWGSLMPFLPFLKVPNDLKITVWKSPLN